MTANQDITSLAGNPDALYSSLNAYIDCFHANADGEDYNPCKKEKPLKRQILDEIYGPWWVRNVLDVVKSQPNDDKPCWMEEEE